MSKAIVIALSVVEFFVSHASAAGAPSGTDTIPPSPVANLTSSAGSDQINLSWGTSTDNVGVAGYKVYRDEVLVGTVSTTAYADTGLPASTSYTYTVYAYDAAGNVSKLTSSSTWHTSTTGGTIVGMNLAGIADWGSQIEFVDFMKQARPWVFSSQTEWDSGSTIPLNGSGYPVQVPYTDPVKGPLIAQTVIVTATGGHYPAGNYTLMLKGSGQISIRGDSPTTTYNAPGTYQVPVTPSNGGLFLTILKSDPADPISGINLIAPGYENTYTAEPFYPLFLGRLAKMKVLRFKDQMATDNSPVTSWDQRTLPTSFTQAGPNGVAAEYIVDISNQVGADPWINIPHQADDNYVHQLARLLKDGLNPDRKVYVEYSNEVWNNIFAQAGYAAEQGALLFPLDINGSFGQRLKFQVRRSGEIFDIFEQEFGDTSRLVRVIGSQAGNSWTGNFVLDNLADPTINPSLKPADALAIAPYFGYEIADSIGGSNQIESISVNAIVNLLIADVAAQMVPAISANKAAANAHGVRLISYEGGQSLVSNNPVYQNNQTLTGKLNAANRSQQMRSIYLAMFNTWFAGSDDLFNVYSYVTVYGKYGSWGLLEWQDEGPLTAPKFSAMQQFVRSQTGQ